MVQGMCAPSVFLLLKRDLHLRCVLKNDNVIIMVHAKCLKRC